MFSVLSYLIFGRAFGQGFEKGVPSIDRKKLKRQKLDISHPIYLRPSVSNLTFSQIAIIFKFILSLLFKFILSLTCVCGIFIYFLS